ncbi:hypothetical protein D1BOALGB6SA_7874 [Olavius sp. associated proteobacterium Delta 1]|nr:hypothetical protein D1BOALGB6SA_7874 [Olavius sp. associated proteobacterium Delta 1]
MKIQILQLAVVAFYLAGCAATHYHEILSDGVIFYLKVPEARGVAFASSLDAYSPHLARKVDGSRWAVTVPAGSEFRYFYIVDGAVYVPECQFYEKDDFGSRNCIYVPE